MKNKKTTRFGLVRHAETFWNRERRIQGQSDSPLTVKGKKDADNWGQRLSRFSWDCILMSDSGRAVETATRINHYLRAPMDSDPRLREQDWGRWTGQIITQIETEAAEALPAAHKTGWHFCPPGGEDRMSVCQRSHRALKEAAARWRGHTIMIVTHEGVIKTLIYHLCGHKFLPGEPALIKPYHLHWLIYSNNALQIEKVNALNLI
jgi:probable phosphoglycerate mutase